MVNLKDFFNKCLGQRKKKQTNYNNPTINNTTNDNLVTIELQSNLGSANLLVEREPNLSSLPEITTEREENIALFHTGYQSLTQTIWPNNDQGTIVKDIIEALKLERTSQRIFADKYDIYQTGGIWENNFSNSTSEQLKNFLEKLDENVKNMSNQFQVEKNQLTEQEWFKIVAEQTDLLNKKTQAQIEIPAKD